MAAVQNCFSARMRRKRDGCGNKTEMSRRSEGPAGNTWCLFPARIQRHSDFPKICTPGKMGKVRTHTEVVWFLLIGDTHHIIGGLCTILKVFYGEEGWDIIKSKHSLQTLENAVATSQGMVHLSSKELSPAQLKILILLHEAKSRIQCLSFYNSRKHVMKSPRTQMLPQAHKSKLPARL